MILLGLTGTLGAGKGTVVQYLVTEKGYTYASVSQFLADDAVRRSMTPDRMARHTVANEYRAQGATALMEATFAAVSQTATHVVLEPQHTKGEVEFIQSKGGKVIAVDAPLRTRYDRIAKRGSEKDNVSFEEFAAHERMELASDDPNRNNLAAAIGAADFRITNDGTLEDLHAQIEHVLATMSLS